MAKPDPDELEALLDRIDRGEPIDGSKLRDIAADFEEGKKYRCATCQMFCTGENVLVIFNTETEEFVQIEIPMQEGEEVIITRAS